MSERFEMDPDDMLARRLAGSMTDGYLKLRLREEMRRRISVHPGGDSAAVVKEVAAYLSGKPAAAVVAVFAALPGEVDLRSLPAQVSKAWVFPRVEEGNLVFHQVEDFEKDLEKGAFGIMEPRMDSPQVGISDVDVFLCPGLAFDLKGGRLGRGKGFYDRMLEMSRPDALKVGVCFGYQLMDWVMMERHDVRMNAVIAG